MYELSVEYKQNYLQVYGWQKIADMTIANACDGHDYAQAWYTKRVHNMQSHLDFQDAYEILPMQQGQF